MQNAMQKEETIKAILLNRSYMDGSGMLAIVRDGLRKLSRVELNNLKLLIDIKMRDAVCDEAAARR